MLFLNVNSILACDQIELLEFCNIRPTITKPCQPDAKVYMHFSLTGDVRAKLGTISLIPQTISDSHIFEENAETFKITIVLRFSSRTDVNQTISYCEKIMCVHAYKQKDTDVILVLIFY